MKQHYSYDELYGTLIYRNEEDTERTYHIGKSQYYKFYRWMYASGWDLVDKFEVMLNGLTNFKVTLKRSDINADN